MGKFEMIRKYALGAAFSVFLSFAALTCAWAANPLGIAFKTTTNVSLYGKPTGTLITGRCNPYDAAFTTARSKGAEILMYLAPAERPDRYVCAQDNKFYMNDLGRVPLWRYPSYGQRINWATTRLTDMRPGSPWILHVVSYVEGLMREGKVDGVFLDVVGARLWSRLADWNSWPQAEKNLWTDGNIDLVRRLDAKRRAINPFFIIVNNNVWERGDTRGYAGERHVDGVMLEHPKAGSAWHINYAKKPFGNLGQRRVLVVGNNKAEAQQWAKIPGVTHVSDQVTYVYPTPPPVTFQYLGDRTN